MLDSRRDMKGQFMITQDPTPGSSFAGGERFSALRAAIQTKKRKIEKMTDSQGKNLPVSEYFGCLTFGLAQMRVKLPRDSYQNLLKTLDQGKKDRKSTRL